jgi:hypothetical protein
MTIEQKAVALIWIVSVVPMLAALIVHHARIRIGRQR